MNGQDKIAFCYASRLFDKKDDLLNNNKKEENESDKNKIENDNTIPIIVSKEKKNSFLFDKLEKENVILNPKNYYLKIIFSNIYKDIFFKDKIFQKIKKSFISKYRNKLGLDLTNSRRS